MNYQRIRSFVIATVLLLGGAPLLVHAQLPVDLPQWIEERVEQFPGRNTGAYQLPSADLLDTWTQTIAAIQERERDRADSLAHLLEYELIDVLDTLREQTYWILKRQDDSEHHWGIYVFNLSPLRKNVFLQAPHAVFDQNTGVQAAFVFRETGAAYLALNGTHRCNSFSATSCSGRTSVCGDGSAPYRISDLAHEVNSLFHRATADLEAAVSNLYVIQLHGFGRRSTDPFVMLSNGTNRPPQGEDLLLAFGEALQDQDFLLSFGLHHREGVRLPGTTNVQGRLLNGSSLPCLGNGITNSGRFWHIEQERTRLRADRQGWQKVARALNRVLPENPLITRTQDISLKQGWNWVSLSLSPVPEAVAATFGEQLHEIIIVKDDIGRVLVPTYDIDDLMTWNPQKAYRIKADTTVQLQITGTDLSATQATLSLSAGWNTLPFHCTTPLPPEEALSPLLDKIDQVKDQQGATFIPATNHNDIGLLQPGQGYLIRLREAATFSYACPPE